jgi:hypothetical protein
LDRSSGVEGEEKGQTPLFEALYLPCYSQGETIPPPFYRLALKRIKEIITG